jgi:hypothetical protein
MTPDAILKKFFDRVFPPIDLCGGPRLPRIKTVVANGDAGVSSSLDRG